MDNQKTQFSEAHTIKWPNEKGQQQ